MQFFINDLISGSDQPHNLVFEEYHIVYITTNSKERLVFKKFHIVYITTNSRERLAILNGIYQIRMNIAQI